MKKNYYFIAILVLMTAVIILGFTHKTEPSGGILTMRVYEGHGPWSDNITIVAEDGAVEKIELRGPKLGNISTNLMAINENLNKIKSKGYKLVSTVVAGMEASLVTTYTFERE